MPEVDRLARTGRRIRRQIKRPQAHSLSHLPPYPVVMGNSKGREVLRAVWLDEMALEDGSRPEVVLSVVVGDADARRLTARETLDVGLRALVERDHGGIVVRLHWWISGAKYEHRLDPADRRTVELMRRLAVQPLLPLVVSSRRGIPLQVYDCDNMFRADAAGTRRPGCRHPGPSMHKG